MEGSIIGIILLMESVFMTKMKIGIILRNILFCGISKEFLNSKLMEEHNENTAGNEE